MKKRILAMMACAWMLAVSGQVMAEETTEAVTETAQITADCPLEDGVYTAMFTTDSGMFHVNELYEDRGVLTVEDGQMTIHVSLASKKIENLYFGLAEDAKKDGAVMLDRTVDEVVWAEDDIEEVYGFDIPVPVLDEEFDVALIGSKGKWYDHKVMVSDPQPLEEAETE